LFFQYDNSTFSSFFQAFYKLFQAFSQAFHKLFTSFSQAFHKLFFGKSEREKRKGKAIVSNMNLPIYAVNDRDTMFRWLPFS
jgi:hypothetical protein